MGQIGILTFHKSINYGSVLQCWALQEFLRKNGYEVEIINYEPKAYSKIYGILGRKSIKSIINRSLLSLKIKNQITKFSEFRKEFLNVGKELYYFDSDFSALNKYDAIVCGSDQIWNIRARDCDPIYFLPFSLQGKKIAYAVSVNNTSFDEPQCNEELRENILDFAYISIREKSGADKLKRFIGGRCVDTVLDPTLLHTKESYGGIVSGRIIPRDYIFLYSVSSNKEVFEAAKILSRKYKMPVYTGFMAREASYVLKTTAKGIHVVLSKTSPQDFLSLIKYSKYVCTDSFHGTAFSLIFEKQFCCINTKLESGHLKNDERIVNILSSIGLENRYVTVETINDFAVEGHIDFEKVRKIRMQIAEESGRKLLDAIQ